MFVLSSELTLGGKVFTGVHEVKLKRSVYELAATATIQLPVTAVLRSTTEPPTRVETAQAVRVGDRVVIRLGYDGRYETEFRGYVKLLNLKSPLEIVCEDEFYTARARRVTLQGRTTLEKLLADCGLRVGYATPLTLAAFQADDKPVAWVLSQLQTEYGLTIWFGLDGRVYASEPAHCTGPEVYYRLRENVISDDDLQYHRASDVKLKIKAVCVARDGTRTEAEAGEEGGTVKECMFYDVEDPAELAALADAELKRYAYDGYSGKITTFLRPFAEPGMAARIEDRAYEARNGTYYIESVETSFGTEKGARRTVEIGQKLWAKK